MKQEVFVSELKLPLLVNKKGQFIYIVPIELRNRITDCLAILNSIKNKYFDFIRNLEVSSTTDEEIDENIRYELIQTIFSYTTFLFLLIGFYKKTNVNLNDLIKRTDFVLKEALPFPKESESGTIKILRKIRNKMIAHSAYTEPKPDDSQQNQFAYLQWFVGFWGNKTDYMNRQLNSFGLSIEGKSSNHVVPPRFDVLVQDSENYLKQCEFVLNHNATLLVNELNSKEHKDYMFITFY